MYKFAQENPKNNSNLFSAIKCSSKRDALLDKVEIIYKVDSEGHVIGFLRLI